MGTGGMTAQLRQLTAGSTERVKALAFHQRACQV
jgi:hypothetical protein